jgi:hypothetical protein
MVPGTAHKSEHETKQDTPRQLTKLPLLVTPVPWYYCTKKCHTVTGQKLTTLRAHTWYTIAGFSRESQSPAK